MDTDLYTMLPSALAALAGLLAGLGLGIFAGRRQQRAQAGELAAARRRIGGLRRQLVQLQTRLGERERQHKARLDQLGNDRHTLQREFENLANRIFEERGRQFRSSSMESLQELLKPFREQIAGFEVRVNQLHSESLRNQVSLEAEIRKVLEAGLEMSAQATSLSDALKGDNKTVGNWGEAQLERSLQLAGLERGDHYEAQSAFRDPEGRQRYPDFVVKLPDDRHLVIDSKVSLVDYDRALSAADEQQRGEALEAHTRALRRHIDDLAAKDYAALPGMGSPDFVLMFTPLEPAYIEALRHDRELFNYGYRRGVILVSHTTMLPLLRTVANLWLLDRSNAEARELGARAGELYNQVCLVAERLQRLGNTLSAAGNHYNDTVRALVGKQGLHGKVERFRQLSSEAARDMPPLQPVHPELDTRRLDTARSAQPGTGATEGDAGDSSETREECDPITDK